MQTNENSQATRLALRRHYETAEPLEGRGEPERLPEGNLTPGVLRIGQTIRRPHLPQSLAVADYLDHLERAGSEGSPRYLGRDEQGRDVLTYIEGEVPGNPVQAWAGDDEVLTSLAVLLRELHEASSGYGAERGFAALPGTRWRRDLVRIDLPIPDPTPELVSHLDVIPSNVVIREGRAVALIDFDLAGPTTRLLNVYNTAAHWVPLCPPDDVPAAWRHLDRLRRLRRFADAYGLDEEQRSALIDLGIARADISWLRLKASAEQLGGGWARMWENGAGDAVRRRQDWLRRNRADLSAALHADQRA